MSFVGKSIRLVLNAIPRPILQRVAGWAVPMLGVIYAGKGRKCPICGCERRKFLPYGYGKVREDALCPKCLSLERHRLLWHYLMNNDKERERFQSLPTILHIAPDGIFVINSIQKHTKSLFVGRSFDNYKYYFFTSH